MQSVFWIVSPASTNSRGDHANNILALVVLRWYVPRAFQIYPLNRCIIKTTGAAAKSSWAAAIYNLQCCKSSSFCGAKFVAHQFKRLQNKKLQQASRYYSHQWRTWGACFIQFAWRRYKKKMAKRLCE
ncbi:hypothetical protein SLE2022_193120 [Rubroshorea leprosula]